MTSIKNTLKYERMSLLQNVETIKDLEEQKRKIEETISNLHYTVKLYKKKLSQYQHLTNDQIGELPIGYEFKLIDIEINRNYEVILEVKRKVDNGRFKYNKSEYYTLKN